jgi:aminobenzoyl-glutamate utilization protein A
MAQATTDPTTTLDVAALRREFHRHPETAFREVRTAARIADTLAGLGLVPRLGEAVIRTGDVVDYPTSEQLDESARRAVDTGAEPGWVARVREAGTAVVADLTGAQPGPRWALRFDTDALPITESGSPEHIPKASGFASTFAGAMHACGHDGHAAIGLVLAQRLTDDHGFPGSVRLLFQPAEEGGRGARSMLPAGVLDDVDRFLALHLGLDHPTRHVVGGVVGAFATTKLRARFIGVASHASAAPQEGRNALAAAAAGTLAVLAQPRWSTADTRVNVGTLHAGDNVNIIPAWAELTAETRALDAEVHADLTQRVVAALRGAAQTYGCDVEVVETGGSTTLASDTTLAEQVAAAATGLGATAQTYGPMGGSDDASLFMAEVQRRGGTATYVVVGADNPAPHHNPAFDIDEDALGFSVDLLETVIRQQPD